MQPEANYGVLTCVCVLWTDLVFRTTGKMMCDAPLPSYATCTCVSALHLASGSPQNKRQREPLTDLERRPLTKP